MLTRRSGLVRACLAMAVSLAMTAPAIGVTATGVAASPEPVVSTGDEEPWLPECRDSDPLIEAPVESLSGLVTDSADPVAGAQARLVPLDQFQYYIFDYVQCVTTGADGGFVLPPGVDSPANLVVVDPPAGNTTLASAFRVFPGSTGSAVSPPLMLTNNASMSGTVRFDWDEGEPETYEQFVEEDGATYVLVCIETEQSGFNACGTVGDRGHAQASFRIGLPPGFTPTGANLVVFVRAAKGTTKAHYTTLPEGELGNLTIDIPMGDGGGDGTNLSNGCNAGATPTITGTVRNGGTPYVGSTVSAFAGRDLPGVPAQWPEHFLQLGAVTNDQGQFGLCLDLTHPLLNFLFAEPGSKQLRVVAASTERGPAATLGDTASAAIDITNRTCSACSNIVIGMQAPTLRGQIVGADEIEIGYDNSNSFHSDGVATLATEPDGRFAVAFPFDGEATNYVVTARQAQGNALAPTAPLVRRLETLPTAQAPFTLSDSLPQATHRVEFRQPSGAALGQNDWAYVRLWRSDTAECSDPNDNDWQRYLAGCFVALNMRGNGFSASLSAGTYVMSVQAKVGQSTLPEATVSLIVAADGSLSGPFTFDAATSRWVYRLSSAALSFDLRATNGLQVSTGARVWIQRVNPTTRWYEFAPSAALQADGTWGWTPAASNAAGIYRVELTPPPGRTDLPQTVRYFKITGSGSGAQLTHRCTQPWPPNGSFLNDDSGFFISDANCSTFTPGEGESSTVMRLTFDDSNLTFRACKGGIGEGCEAFSNDEYRQAEVEVRRIMVGLQSDDAGTYLQRFNDVWQGRFMLRQEGGSVRIPVPQNGIDLFQVQFLPPYGNPDLLSKVTKRLLIVSKSAEAEPVGWSNGWYLCTTDECTNRTPFTSPTDDEPASFGDVLLPESSVVARVQRPDGTPLTRQTWVEVSQWGSCPWSPGEQCFNYMQSVDSRAGDGKVGIDLPMGLYELRANRPFNDTANLAPGRTLIEVGANGLVARATASGVTLLNAATLNDPVPIKLTEPNVAAILRAGGAVRPVVGIGVERWNASFGYWQGTNQWSQTDRNGVARFSLDEGRWRLRAWPQGSDAGLYTEALLEVEIDVSRTITKVGGVAYSPGTPIYLDYGVPNLSGVLRGPGGNPIGSAGLGLQTWNGQFFEGGQWNTTRMNGAFGFSIPFLESPQFYRLEVNPPVGQGARTAKFLWAPSQSVSATKHICFVDRSQVDVGAEPACATAETDPAPYDITLDGANLTGVVLGALGDVGPSAQAAWVYARKWNGNWFDWIDQWSDARAGSGAFDFVLEAPGFYEITAEPRPGSGFTKTSLYVQVSTSATTPAGSAYCLSSVVNANGRDEPNVDDCRPAQLVADRLPLMLTGSNLRAAVTYSVSNSAGTETLSGSLRDGWVEVFDTTDEWPQWVNSVGVNQSGAFALRLEARSTTEATRYQVVVSPSTWNPVVSALNLGKQRLSLWATTSAETGTVLCWNDPTLGECQQISSTGVISVVLGGGNVAGFVSEPSDSEVGVRDAQIQVERWEPAFDGWQWANEWTQTSAQGRFALSLDPGQHYRLTVRPPWGRSDASPNSAIIRVEEGGVCQVAVGTLCNNTFLTTVALSLGLPNVSATIFADVEGAPTPQRDVWVGVEKLMTESWGTWWQWTGNGSNTAANGNVGLKVDEAGSYRMVVEAPWSSSVQDLTRFTREFSVSVGGVVTWAAGTTVSAQGRAQLSYPSANAVFTVNDPQAVVVRDAWVHAEQWVDGRWEWTPISGSTRGNGRVALRLPDSAAGVVDTYRIAVNPPWNRSGLVRFFAEVTVSGSTVHRNEGFTLTFPSSNVNGVVLATGRADGAIEVPNRHGWIEVRTAGGEWVEGTSTSQNGRFALYLPNPAGGGGSTVYTLVAHPNYGQFSARPLRLTVTVSGATPVLDGCVYETSGASCLVGGQIDAAFDFVPPNFLVQVTNSAGPLRGAFVRITDSGNGSFVDLVTDSEGFARANLPTGRTYDVRAVSVNGTVTSGQSSGHALGAAPDVVTVSIGL